MNISEIYQHDAFIQDLEDNQIKYVNDINKLEYLSDQIKNIDKEYILYLNKTVDRSGTIAKFVKIFKDIDTSIKLEAGIFEFTIIYTYTKNYIMSLMMAIYNDKVHDILCNLDPKDPIDNKTLIGDIKSNKINPQIVAFLPPQDVHPERWKGVISKINLKEEKKKNMATTDLYQCHKCKERKCSMIELQLRGLDEPMTRIITCLVCGHVMKKN